MKPWKSGGSRGGSAGGSVRKFDSVIFDLDGTLWDAADVTVSAWKKVLDRHPDAKPAVRIDRNTVCLNMGVTNEELAGIFFPDLPFEEAFALISESCDYENEWLPTRGGVLYPGVPETLDRLRREGYRLFVVSNAQDGYVESFLTAHRLWDVFEDIESSGRTGHGKAWNIRDVVERRKLLSPVYVGDTVSDSEGAHGAGIPFVYCRYGFGETFGNRRTSDWEYAIDRFDELPGVLERA